MFLSNKITHDSLPRCWLNLTNSQTKSRHHHILHKKGFLMTRFTCKTIAGVQRLMWMFLNNKKRQNSLPTCWLNLTKSQTKSRHHNISRKAELLLPRISNWMCFGSNTLILMFLNNENHQHSLPIYICGLNFSNSQPKSRHHHISCKVDFLVTWISNRKKNKVGVRILICMFLNNNNYQDSLPISWLNFTKSQTKSRHHHISCKEDFLVARISNWKKYTKVWGATSAIHISERQKHSASLANMLIELHKLSDQVQTSSHLAQGRFSADWYFRLEKKYFGVQRLMQISLSKKK